MSEPDQLSQPEFLEGPGLSDAELGLVPGWPKAVGIVSICWGALSLGCAGCGAVGTAMPAFLGAQMQQAFPDGMPPIMTDPPMTTWVQLVLGALLSILLLIAGIMLVMRSGAARALHLLYAALGIVIGAWGVYIGFMRQAELTRWINEHPDTRFAQSQGGGGGNLGFVLGMFFGVILGFAYPIFCLVWFGLVKRTRESMTGGVEAAA